MDITTIATWILATNAGPYVLAFFTVLGALLAIASAIVPFTKTTEDDAFVAKAKALFDRFSIFPPKK